MFELELEMIEERYELAICRIREIKNENIVSQPFQEYFEAMAGFIIRMDAEYDFVKSGRIFEASLEELMVNNKQLYVDILPENYGKSYADPAYAVSCLSEQYGQLLSFLYMELRSLIVFAYEKDINEMTIRMELFLEIYQGFVCAYEETKGLMKWEELRQIIYWYVSDYYEIQAQRILKERLEPCVDLAYAIIMQRDLTDLRYLYYFGEYVSDNEYHTAKHLHTMEAEKIKGMASTFTEGFRIGFDICKKNFDKKKTICIRYVLGFEQVVRQAIVNYKAMGLETVLYRSNYDIFHGRGLGRNGYTGAVPNKQCDYDHKDDLSLILDKQLLNRKLEVYKSAYEKRREQAGVYAGPAVIETFGEVPFAPISKKEAPTLSKKQQKLMVEHMSANMEMQNAYMNGEEISFTIIAFPIPAIGPNFGEIFDEIVAINTLDYALYQRIQQSIIDALDKAEIVRLKGMNGNKTDLTIKLHTLLDPEKETNFENCVADVNIPVGEVFTSPVLAGTEGTLHVKKVFLKGLAFDNLEIQFKDGMIETYHCTNFATEEENEKYIKDNILSNHKTLPMGEFAIGTNTVAYMVAKKYNIADVLPILIAEKMGPHFAVGDTCYSHAEDLVVYNPNKKEIIARDNEISALRKTDFSSAYFNCHTDITIPYDELGQLYAKTKEGEVIAIITKGRFVLEGCQELNRPFDEYA